MGGEQRRARIEELTRWAEKLLDLIPDPDRLDPVLRKENLLSHYRNFERAYADKCLRFVERQVKDRAQERFLVRDETAEDYAEMVLKFHRQRIIDTAVKKWDSTNPIIGPS